MSLVAFKDRYKIKKQTSKLAPSNHDGFFADVSSVARIVSKSNSRDATSSRKNLRAQGISEMDGSDVVREIFNKKTRFDGETELGRKDVRLATSQRRIDIIDASFLEPSADVDDRARSDYKGCIRGVRA